VLIEDPQLVDNYAYECEPVDVIPTVRSRKGRYLFADDRYKKHMEALENDWSKDNTRLMCRLSMLRRDVVPIDATCITCTSPNPTATCEPCQPGYYYCMQCINQSHAVYT
jgi:hypothetical protein